MREHILRALWSSVLEDPDMHAVDVLVDYWEEPDLPQVWPTDREIEYGYRLLTMPQVKID